MALHLNAVAEIQILLSLLLIVTFQEGFTFEHLCPCLLTCRGNFNSQNKMEKGGIVFSTFLLRSVFTVLYAMAQAFQSSFKTCTEPNVRDCDACLGLYSNVQTFIIYEPAFQNIVILLASPLALLVAWWGMSPTSALRDASVESEL